MIDVGPDGPTDGFDGSFTTNQSVLTDLQYLCLIIFPDYSPNETCPSFFAIAGPSERVKKSSYNQRKSWTFSMAVISYQR